MTNELESRDSTIGITLDLHHHRVQVYLSLGCFEL